MDKILLTPSEVSELLGLGRSRTYEMLAQGEIPAIRISPRAIRIPAKKLEQWIDEHPEYKPESVEL